MGKGILGEGSALATGRDSEGAGIGDSEFLVTLGKVDGGGMESLQRLESEGLAKGV